MEFFKFWSGKSKSNLRRPSSINSTKSGSNYAIGRLYLSKECFKAFINLKITKKLFFQSPICCIRSAVSIIKTKNGLKVRRNYLLYMRECWV